MTKTEKIIISVNIIALMFVILFMGANVGRANPSFYSRSPGTSSATTSMSFMTPGTGTTTETFNTGLGSSQAVDSAILRLALLGSTTPVTATYATTSYRIAIEYSDNCIDWSRETYLDASTATTSQSMDFSAPWIRSITLGNSNAIIVGGTKISTTTPTYYDINVPTPTKCVRAVATIPSGSTNGAIWMQFVGKRETSY